jgi:hypothetical protein
MMLLDITILKMNSVSLNVIKEPAEAEQVKLQI